MSAELERGVGTDDDAPVGAASLLDQLHPAGGAEQLDDEEEVDDDLDDEPFGNDEFARFFGMPVTARRNLAEHFSTGPARAALERLIADLAPSQGRSA